MVRLRLEEEEGVEGVDGPFAASMRFGSSTCAAVIELKRRLTDDVPFADFASVKVAWKPWGHRR